MHRDAPQLIADDLALAGVEACPDFDPKPTRAVPDAQRTADSSRGAVEGRQHTVACRVDLSPPEAADLLPSERAVAFQKVTPPMIAHLRRPLGRCDDVGERHSGEDPVALAPVALAG